MLLNRFLLHLFRNNKKNKNRFNFVSIFIFLCYNDFGDKMKKAKKINSQKRTNSIISTDNEMSKLIILILVVALVFALFYIITLFVTEKDDAASSNNEENTEVKIQYEKILAGNILSQKNDEYYVLVYFDDDKYVDYYKNHLMYYSTKDSNSVTYYFVDMSDVFNKAFISDKSVLNVTKAKDFKFSQTALLRINNSKVISTYEGNEQIKGKLGRMTK